MFWPCWVLLCWRWWSFRIDLVCEFNSRSSQYTYLSISVSNFHQIHTLRCDFYISMMNRSINSFTMQTLRMLLMISLWCVYFFILVCYNDKYGIVAIGLTVAELECHKTNMNTKAKHIIRSILKYTLYLEFFFYLFGFLRPYLLKRLQTHVQGVFSMLIS